MGLWSQLIRPAYRASYSDADHFWYNPVGWGGAGLGAGVPNSPEGALRTSAVWACVNVLSRTQAMLPPIVSRNREDGGKERNDDHRVARVFRKKPNAWQSPFQFRQFAMVCILLRGNFYGKMGFDGAGRLTEVVPMHPDRVRARQLDSGRVGFEYRPVNGPVQMLTQDDVHHVVGLSLDGVTGVSVIEYARETFGRAISQESSNAAFYRNGMEVGSVIKGPPGVPMGEKAFKQLQADLADKRGAMNAGKTLILEQGYEFQKLGMTARDSQFVESSYATIEDICRWFGVQPHLIAHLLRATNNNIEHQGLEYVTYSLLPWNVAWESAAQRDLFADDDDHSLKFNVDMLLRGDTLSRYQAQAIGIMNGFLAENEARIQNDMNPVPGLWTPHRSANQDRGGDPQGPRPGKAPTPEPDEEDDEPEDTAAARGIVRKVAARLVRNEVAAIRARSARGGLDREGVAAFYGRHIEALTDALCLDESSARRYGADHCALLLEHGAGAVEDWETQATDRLVAMALAPKENGHHVGA